MKTIKLSIKQKDVIKYLRKFPNAYIVWFYFSQEYYLKTVIGNFDRLRDATVINMQINDILEHQESSTYSCKRFKLTELGKTIQL